MPVERAELLRANARRRSEQTLKRARETLDAMTARADTITAAGLARAAGVSRSWIYTQPELRDRIEQLRVATPPRTPGPAGASRASLESVKRRLDLAHQRITQLREENTQLRRSVEQLHGQLREQHSR